MAGTERPAYWAVIPASVRYDTELSPNAKLLYGEVTALSDKLGYCYAQNSYFSKLFGLSDRSITRLFAALAERGYLRVDVIRDEATQEVLERRIYAVYSQEESEPPPDKIVGSSDNFDTTPPDTREVLERRIYAVCGQEAAAPPPDKIVGTPPDNFVTTPPDKNVQENNTSIEYIPPIVPQGGQAKKKKTKSVPTWKPERFEAFWAFYPRHEDRVSAVREWDRLKPDDALIDAIARALKWQVRAEDWPAPYACRYLRNQRWTDEPKQGGKVGPPKARARQLTGWHTEVINGEEVLVPDAGST
ncbi:helix-turn-helix domain-containing protein [Intestinimonas butyriciproducens]|uniref:Helix-turn-helix protein n=1 Tax=Intestinimonas butyriciproducens TaxID=1297617 RepID=A0A2U1BBZ9_9FIRM|nr:helix-turn-helix domain-containing protein [Intestinimonas butyriciproducens]MCR1907074.1 helix-turn-helix domain-containing protein [Intestinimonas butyriciproducens]PVY46180.1 helix-turn-helix protein [Intestinimonas butyriciproducens]QBB65386.1 Phage replication initiation protein [Intestinimonas butyriciproducens]